MLMYQTHVACNCVPDLYTYMNSPWLSNTKKINNTNANNGRTCVPKSSRKVFLDLGNEAEYVRL